jgi:formyltetrahydrofolate deformylase
VGNQTWYLRGLPCENLARYLSGCCINIHHGFLPSFKGAKPYHQAHERGVKMIGATARAVADHLQSRILVNGSRTVVFRN